MTSITSRSNSRSSLALPLAALALAISACGPSENAARQYLEKQGITVTELKKSGGSFEFTGKKGGDVCTGTVTLAGSSGSTSESLTDECKLDVSACRPGAPLECDRLADALYVKEAKIFPTQAAELYRIACADGNSHGCGRAGEFEGIVKNWDKLREYSKKGCELGDGDACRGLALSELEGQGTAKNEANALELMKKGCGLSSVLACRGAAGLLLDMTPPDPAAAIPFADKVCSAKLDDGCFVLGLALFRSKSDFPRALTNLDAVCNDATQKNNGAACSVAGAIAFDGLGMKKDIARGFASIEKACDLGSPEGCYNAAKIYRAGTGVPRNPEKAAALLAKSCKLGKQEACSLK